MAGEVVSGEVKELQGTGGKWWNRTGELVTGKVEVKEVLTRGKSVCNVAEVLVGREVKVLKS